MRRIVKSSFSPAEADMLHFLKSLIAAYRSHMRELNGKMTQFDRMHASR